MQGRDCPPTSVKVKLPSAAVVVDIDAPLAHFAVAVALASAAPVAATPEIVGELVEPPPQAASTAAAASAASIALI
jgi:hypothetical protein